LPIARSSRHLAAREAGDWPPATDDCSSHRPIIRVLHIDAKILLPKQSDNLLEGISILAADAYQIALDCGLNLLL
jgi:hypothetical protein